MQPVPSGQLERDQHIENMQNIFAENMLSFKKHMKPIYDYFIEYNASSVFIDIDENGYLNLKQDGKAIYPGDPVHAHRQQFNLFLNSPRHFRFKPKPVTLIPETGRNFLHSHYLGRIDKLGERALTIAKAKQPKLIPTLAVLGIGMGYHLEMLIDYYDVQNLLVYEPNSDVFYASLFLIRFTPILEHFTSGSNSITIKVGGTANEFCNEVGALSFKRGTYTVSRIYLYRHYNSVITDETFDRLHEVAHRLMQGWGFPEDEMMSLAHTSINARAPMRYIRNNLVGTKIPGKPLPAFIIANGPSLDKDIEYIKTHHDSAVIFSAGSTLVTLHNAGITPDFQVDIERSADVKEVVKDLPLSYREQVTFLTLNTTHPSVVALFPKHAFCLKANDSGTELLTQYIPEEFQDPLTHCNPLAGNGALAFALRLGFKEIVFFGMDMGTVDRSQHHSSKSSYYTPGHKQFQHGGSDFKLERPCNRGGKMYTSELLEYSRFAIEGALANMSGINVKNCSIGLEIQGCDVINHDALTYENDPLAKANLLSHIESQTFQPVSDLAKRTKPDLIAAVKQTDRLANRLLQCIAEKPDNIRAILSIFTEQMQILNQLQETEIIPARMWLGAMRYLHCNIATWLVDLNQENPETKRYIDQALQVMADYITSVNELFTDKYETPFSDHNPDEYLTEDADSL